MRSETSVTAWLTISWVDLQGLATDHGLLSYRILYAKLQFLKSFWNFVNDLRLHGLAAASGMLLHCDYDCDMLSEL